MTAQCTYYKSINDVVFEMKWSYLRSLHLSLSTRLSLNCNISKHNLFRNVFNINHLSWKNQTEKCQLAILRSHANVICSEAKNQLCTKSKATQQLAMTVCCFRSDFCLFLLLHNTYYARRMRALRSHVRCILDIKYISNVRLSSTSYVLYVCEQ